MLNLTAANIKKRAVVGGITGTFQGYVPDATDLYLRGNNIRNWAGTGGVTFDSGQITISSGTAGRSVKISANIQLAGVQYFNVEMNVTTSYSDAHVKLLYIKSSVLYTIGDIASIFTGTRTFSYALAAFQINYPTEINLVSTYKAIYRI